MMKYPTTGPISCDYDKRNPHARRGGASRRRVRSHCETDRPLVLRRGQVGTVVMTYEGPVFEVEFAGKDGRAYAILPIPASKLMILRDTPDYAVA